MKEDQDGNNINDYDYDKNGSVTLDAENQRFIYDAENRLKQFFDGTNSTETSDGEYFYDGTGKRVKKKSATEMTIFVYNAEGTLAAEYSTDLPDVAKVNYLTSDHLGSPRIITDELGAVVSRHDYLSFGDEVTNTVGNVANRTTQQGYGKQDEIRKQYTGYERDIESGLDYAQARYYNSKHGRFTSTDPLTASTNLKDPQTLNRYTYAMNSPYKFTDPLGLLAESTGACGPRCRNSDPMNSGGGYGGLYSENGRSIQIGYSQTQNQTPQLQQPAGDGTVDAASIKPTVSYTGNDFKFADSGRVEYGEFDAELAAGATELAQTAEKIKEASLQNGETALALSKGFIESIDDASSTELRDMYPNEWFWDRDYGGIGQDGTVRIPNEVSSDTITVGGGPISRTGAGTTTVNPGTKAQQKANDQLGELVRMKGANSVERLAFVEKYANSKVTIKNSSGNPTTYTLGRENAGKIFDTAISKGEGAAIARHPKKE